MNFASDRKKYMATLLLVQKWKDTYPPSKPTEKVLTPLTFSQLPHINNENAHVSHLVRVDGVKAPPNKFDLDPVALTYNLDIWPWPQWPWPWTHMTTFSLAENWNFNIFTLVTLTFDLLPWPSNSFEIWWSLICVPNFRAVGPTVQPAKCKQTHTHGRYQKFPPSANVGGNEHLVSIFN